MGNTERNVGDSTDFHARWDVGRAVKADRGFGALAWQLGVEEGGE